MEFDRTPLTDIKTVGDCDIGIIEGNKGLFDGISTDGSDSNAAMAVQDKPLMPINQASLATIDAVLP